MRMVQTSSSSFVSPFMASATARGVFPLQLGAGPLEKAADAQLPPLEFHVLVIAVQPVDAGGLNIVKKGVAAARIPSRPLVVAGSIVYRRDVHQLVHQVEHDVVIGVRVDVHIARHRDEVRGNVLYLPHKVGIVFAVFVEMQVGHQDDAPGLLPAYPP